MRNQLHQLTLLVRASLTPDLLKPEYREGNRTNPSYGHCYVATEALYHLLQQHGVSGGWSPVRARDSSGVVHWWLESSDGWIEDPTEDQYPDDDSAPHDHGRRGGFLTKRPSKRAQVVIDRVNYSLYNHSKLG